MDLEFVEIWTVAPALENLLAALYHPRDYTPSRVAQLWGEARSVLAQYDSRNEQAGPTTAELREAGLDPSMID